MSERLFHLALPDVWEAARGRGPYEISTRGATLAEVGNPQTGEELPHLYGPLPVAAVLTAERLTG